MPSYYCPRCGEQLGEHFLRGVGEEFDCPECDASLSLESVAPDLAREMEEEESEIDYSPERQFDLEEERDGKLENGERYDGEFDPENPPGTRVQYRKVGDQLVFFIPPGASKTNRSIGCFGVMWTAITGGVTIPIIVGGGIDAGDACFVIPFLGIFWAIGLVFLYFWFRGRFGKTYVLLERDRLVVKFELLGREKFRNFYLDGESRARLDTSYSENDRPVFHVAVSTSDKDATFGTFLTREEKRWIVYRINRQLDENRSA